ncbi:MarR family winged helix-turn-helix transcriptional regulator [Planococcus sp. ISL-109]|uniref:MarR family winged helix-turn-helix transcriptional regulator n=1 Tax=Planococcus sp. ISL-109 TaxID=2819166 RepID=UPI001BE573B0|nr:MarR family winged helix-turn-helix transcriptional regulator [Planococcus sp. ISL-109]MBT2581607.1 winged helix-turn-helix transcriptional regulator [Planococcus sp. ISL-109]
MENKRELFQSMVKRFGLLNRNCCTVGKVEISLVQSHILYEIDRRELPSMQEVADALATDLSTFSRQVQSLIKLNLVVKAPSDADKRISVLWLTEEGKELATVIQQDMEAHLDEIFSHMTEFERDIVLQSIKLLNEAMAKSSVCCKPMY